MQDVIDECLINLSDTDSSDSDSGSDTEDVKSCMSYSIPS